MEHVSSEVLDLFTHWDSKSSLQTKTSYQLITELFLSKFSNATPIDCINRIESIITYSKASKLDDKLKELKIIFSNVGIKTYKDIELELELDKWDGGEFTNIAVKRIIDCFSKKSPALNLSDLKLTSLPLCLSNFSHLIELNIQKNQIHTLIDFNHLRILRCSQNKLTFIPTYPSLTTLECCQNEISIIENQPKLKTLVASKNFLEDLPLLEVAELIDISHNLFTRLNPLKRVKTLQVQNNKLKELPNLETLIRLNASNNELETLPNFISLEWADISHNKLTVIPFCKKLSHLKCFHNQLLEKPTLKPSATLFFSPQKQTNLVKFRTKIEELGAFSKLKTARLIRFDFFESIAELNFIQDIYSFIEKLEEQISFKGKAGKKILATAIFEILLAIQQDREFFDFVASEIEEGLSSCSDKSLYTLNQINIACKLKTEADLSKYGEIIKGAFLIEILEKTAKTILESRVKKESHEKKRNLTPREVNAIYAEEIEVFLALQIHFREKFELPIFSKDMLYKFTANLTAEELRFADQEITTYSLQTHLAKDFALRQNFIREKIKELEQSALENLLKPFQDETENILEKITAKEEERKSSLVAFEEIEYQLIELQHEAGKVMLKKKEVETLFLSDVIDRILEI
jgi:hypothetical protein